MDSSVEIRKLAPSHVRGLSNILESPDSWKRLMSIIPKKLDKLNYACDISVDNLPKYNSEHFRLIEHASVKCKRDCTAILFDEWGTSGKIRPALGHLLYLLVKAELFRAADYVALEILHQPPPPRPREGPAALVSMDVTKRCMDTAEIERHLDAIAYPSFAIEYIRNHSIESNNPENAPNVIPKIVISESPNINVEENPLNFSMPIVLEKKSATNIEEASEVSDMMKFSSEVTPVSEGCAINENLPQLSVLLNKSENVTESKDYSDSMDYSSEIQSTTSISNVPSTNDNPAFSKILTSSHIPNIPDLLQSNSENRENLRTSPENCEISALTNASQIPDINLSTASVSENKIVESNVEFLPNFNLLQNSSISTNVSLVPTSPSAESSTTVPIMSHNSNQSSSSRPCISPLPNLSLNTLLPHFTYQELQAKTNNFNSTPFTTEDELGRWLGSGAFGSVYLALGLMEKPVAVKKIILDNVAVVNVDDTVTKQFRNEVEVLSKYKHENLLSLLGYSCDGCTYCLLYEYVPGGALKDRLLLNKNKLIWTERLYIAIGTSRAVSYLHTAFTTPLIHRDVKSANILLDSNNKPKLCDFGLIKLTPSQNTNTGTTVFGTSAYMAPEAFRGDISVKLDTFSFGVVLFELLTSLPPFDENREGGHDLVTHITDYHEDGNVEDLLDKGAGSWVLNNYNFAHELFEIALVCIEEKKKRPRMPEVTARLDELLTKAF